jgi:hypothetical protein
MKPLFKDTCPHCYFEADPFAGQRCSSCGLNMRSDREYRLLMEKIKGMIEEIEVIRQDVNVSDIQIQPLVNKLLPYGKALPFLEEYIQEAKAAIEPALIQEYRLRQRKVMHLAVLLLLLMVPLVAALWEAPLTMTGLLFLPVLGWTWLGVLPLYRKTK